MSLAERRDREKEKHKNMRRKQIIDAAKIVFHKKGFNNTKMEDIAAEAELSPASLYIYFKSKEEIYVSLNISSINYLKEKLEDLSNADDLGTVEKLEVIKDTYFSVFEDDPSIIMNLLHFQTGGHLKNLTQEQRLSKIGYIGTNSVRLVTKIFEDGIREGVFIEHHPSALSDIFWAVFTGLVVWEESKRMIDPKKDYLKQTLDIAFEIFSRGIRRERVPN